MTIAYQEVFSRGASRFTRWALSPFLLLFAVIFVFPLLETLEEGRVAGTVICAGLIIACLAGVLALWGVPMMGRIVSGIVGLGFSAYLVHECFLDFDGDWGWGKSRSQPTPINSILAFLTFGLPCLLYTVLGRFTRKGETEEDSGDYPEEENWMDEDKVDAREERR